MSRPLERPPRLEGIFNLKLKQTLTIGLAVLLIFCFCGCYPGQGSSAASRAGQGQEEFDELLKELLPDLVNMVQFDSGFLFLEPGEAGLDDPGSEFGWTSIEDWQDSMAGAEELLAELESFDVSRLDAESQRTLALLKDAYTRILALSDFYMLGTNDLGMQSDAATLGITIMHAPYRTAEDFDRLFAMYRDLDGAFHALIDLEQTRQDAGMGMTRSEIDLAIEEFERLLEGDPPAAQLLGDELIDDADFLSAAQKEEYHRLNAEAVSQHLVPAYEYLIEALEQMEGRQGRPGLAGRMNGREFYEAMLLNYGFDETPQELMLYLEKQYRLCLKEMRALAAEAEDGKAVEAVLDDPGSLEFTGAGSPQEILEYLKEEAVSEFPVIDTGTVVPVLTPEALRANAVTAYYVLAPLDAPLSSVRGVYMNSEEDGADYLTLAHEGFPGHLYQDAYAASQDRSYVRRLLERAYLGASEGWGVYSEIVAAGWAETDAALAEMAALSQLIDHIIWAWADIGVNYFGWNSEELAENAEEAFGIVFQEPDEIAKMVAAMAGTWVPYGVGGTKFLEMRRRAESELGRDFDAAEFHTAVLDAFPASFSMIDAAVEDYIEAAQGRQAA